MFITQELLLVEGELLNYISERGILRVGGKWPTEYEQSNMHSHLSECLLEICSLYGISNEVKPYLRLYFGNTQKVDINISWSSVLKYSPTE